MVRVLLLGGLFLAALVLFQPGLAYAHGFGERYDLPVPLWLYLYGAGATVLVSFVVVGMFLRGRPAPEVRPVLTSTDCPVCGAVLENVLTLTFLRLISVATLGLLVATAFWGNPASILNFSVAFIWVGWWVGLGYVFSLMGTSGRCSTLASRI